MSSVLRKKIDAKLGLPPAVLRFKALWESVERAITPWAQTFVDGQLVCEPELREMRPGPDVRSLLDEMAVYYVNSRASPGIAAIAIDNTGAARVAATRLIQDFELSAQAPAIFLKLMFEAPATALWSELASAFTGHQRDIRGPLFSEPDQAAGGFERTKRYILLAYRILPETRLARIWVVFDLDYLMSAAADADRAAALSKAAGGPHTQALHDSAMSSAIRLDGILDRIHMTIGDCSRLEIGDILPLPDANPKIVTLLAETVSGSIEIGACEMGIWKRQRALKLREPVLKPLTEEIART
jgi:hypothetical protein